VLAPSRRHSNPNRNPVATGAGPVDTDADDLAAFEKQLEIGPCHVVGTSYGALVGLVHALRQPKRVRSLVLAEPPLHPWARRTRRGAALLAAFMADVWQVAAASFERGDERGAMRVLIDGMWGRPVFELLPPPRVQAALRNAIAMKALTLAPEPFPDLDRLAVAQIPVPVLLLRGQHASPLHVCVIDELSRVLGRASCTVIAGAGHGSPIENAEAFNLAVLGFLAGSEPSTQGVGTSGAGL
jgi:pimeloyl-ACP methyl ester carboxylesterase